MKTMKKYMEIGKLLIKYPELMDHREDIMNLDIKMLTLNLQLLQVQEIQMDGLLFLPILLLQQNILGCHNLM